MNDKLYILTILEAKKPFKYLNWFIIRNIYQGLPRMSVQNPVSEEHQFPYTKG